MKVLVCGGRNFRDRSLMFSTLYAIHRESTITLVIQGGATGADALARVWADMADVPCHEEPAQWDNFEPPVRMRTRRDGTPYNALAGPNRNAKMLAMKPDLVVAMPGGSGTEDMVSQARAAGVEVRLVSYDGEMR